MDLHIVMVLDGVVAGTLYGYGNQTWTAETWGRGDVIGVALITAGEMRFYKNGVASNSGSQKKLD